MIHSGILVAILSTLYTYALISFFQLDFQYKQCPMHVVVKWNQIKFICHLYFRAHRRIACLKMYRINDSDWPRMLQHDQFTEFENYNIVVHFPMTKPDQVALQQLGCVSALSGNRFLY